MPKIRSDMYLVCMPGSLRLTHGRAEGLFSFNRVGQCMLIRAMLLGQARRVAVVRQCLEPADVVGVCEGLPAVPAEPRVLLLHAHRAGLLYKCLLNSRLSADCDEEAACFAVYVIFQRRLTCGTCGHEHVGLLHARRCRDLMPIFAHAMSN